MDTPGSEASSDSADSTAEPSSAKSTPAAQPAPPLQGQETLPANDMAVDQDDSDSDISMSAETDDEDEEATRGPSIQVNHIERTEEQPLPLATSDSPVETSNKRKFQEDNANMINGNNINGVAEDVRKRMKPFDDAKSLKNPDVTWRQDKSLLPAEIWHNIFTFLPPRNLGLLLRVNKCFNAYLDPSSSKSSPTPLSRSAVKLLKADTIWKTSRVIYQPGMPAPLKGKSELEMWKLACSFSCQFCGKKQQQNPQPIDQWHPGPGENGNVPIWSFGVRTCGSCLQERSSKEIDLLLSSSIPSILMPALSFVFFTNELHVLPLATLQIEQPPPSIKITKHFFQTHIEELKSEFLRVHSMGTATAEEWIKGLEERGKERRNDAGRWEKWEASGGVTRMRGLDSHKSIRSAVLTRTAAPSSIGMPILHTSKGHNPVLSNNSVSAPMSSQVRKLSQPLQTSFPTKPTPRFDSPAQNGFGPYSRPYPPPRHERTMEEVAELKAARRAEIERRCMELDPPLTAGVLAHMGSFQAAIQIIQPLDDGAWEVLKPRLLSQRQDAEQRENDRLAQFRVVQEHLDEQNHYQNVSVPPDSKDVSDREWDDVQAPLRARLGGYADEIIRDGWNDGEKVSWDNCPNFAAEVLIYVRKRFYAEVAKDEAAVRATGREPELDPTNGPYTSKLILENMKWVFDTKVKPHTEQYRKELFLCNDCENKCKYYGFEGIIQHYAAKHTSALSVGSIVVHWKAEWPEYPPFDPEPANASAKNAYYTTAPSASAPYNTNGPQQNYGYGGFQPGNVSAPMQVPASHVYHESPGPYYGHPQFEQSYSGHRNGPFPPQPQVFTDHSRGYPAHFSAPPAVGHVAGYSEPTQDLSQQVYVAPHPASTQGIYASPHPGPLYSATIPEIAPQQQAAPQQGGQFGYPYNRPVQPPTAQPNNHFTPLPIKTEEYKSQLQDVARNARAVFDSINNLKDVPGSVKVYTIIYHILQRSRAKFKEDPPLAMIVDGLNNNKDMRKVRNIHGLLCRACGLGLPGSSPAAAKKLQSFPQLASHFLKDHEQASRLNNIGSVPDWTEDMIKLPDFTQINSIANARGMDDKKLKLIAEALPEIFTAKPAPIDRMDHAGSSRPYAEVADQNAYDLAPSLDNHDKFYKTVDVDKPSEAGSGAYDSGQYDPRYPRDPRNQEPQTDAEPRYRVIRRTDSYQEPLCAEREESRFEQTPVSPPNVVRRADPRSRVIIREEAPVYLDRHRRYLDEYEAEYRFRRDPHIVAYDGHDIRDTRLVNSRSFQSNRLESPLPLAQDLTHRESRYLPAEEAAVQKNRMYDVVAQISQQAQQAREIQPSKNEPSEAGSEDGELRTLPPPEAENRRSREHTEARNAADRFLDNFQPGESSEAADKKSSDLREVAQPRPSWQMERFGDYPPIKYDIPAEPKRRQRDNHVEAERVVSGGGRPANADPAHNGYLVRERVLQSNESRLYAYDDRYVSSVSEHANTRERSPELVDRRYKLNNVVYRDERQSSARRTPSRYARYESVRLENDRARSRSPLYVDRAPDIHSLHQEPTYRTRTPQPQTQEVTYERAPPRQEYYRVYTDEPRPRSYAEAFEYVQVSDPNGNFIIRRPVRREREPEPIYASYEDDRLVRQPVYETRETRALLPRTDPAYYEEYDPRNPGPPPAEAATHRREIRYQ